MNRIFTIGDVHGCASELEDLLAAIAPGADDQLIFLGDLINKGPDSAGVLERVRSLPNARFIIGNHELRLLRYYRTNDDSQLKPADRETLPHLNAADFALFEQMEHYLYLPEQNVICVHGGFAPGIDWQKQSLDTITSIQSVDPATHTWRKRTDFPGRPSWADLCEGPEFVVYGHTPRRSVYQREHSIGIDTGCANGNFLTAYEVVTGALYQVPAKRTYEEKALPA